MSCDLFSLEETVDACPNKCPLNEPNAFVFSGRCFMVVDQKIEFKYAKSYCKRKHGRLFEPRSLHYNIFVAQIGIRILKDKDTQDMWLGIIAKKGSTWKYATSGETVADVEKEKMLYKTYFMNPFDEFCMFSRRDDTFLWRFGPCQDQKRFICEFV